MSQRSERVMSMVGASAPPATSGPDRKEAIRANLARFVEEQTRQVVGTDLDLFGSGLVSSLFAMELVVHVETAFGVEVEGSELKLDNFRTVDAITELVLRLSV